MSTIINNQVVIAEQSDRKISFIQIIENDAPANNFWGENILANLSGVNIEELQPFRIILRTTPNVWVYINDDIVPIVIENNGILDWDCEELEKFYSLRFIKPQGFNPNVDTFRYNITFCYYLTE